MKKKLTTTTLLLGLLASGAYELKAETPKIIVGIVVDQLRTDYIEQLRPFFGEKGFNRLINEAVYIPNVDFSRTVADAPSGAAVIYTGAWPAINGVPAAEILDRGKNRNIPVLADPSKTRFEYSPENLRVSTLADEFIINNGTLSKAYSVAADPQVAVISAGHAGNAAIWLDEVTGKWNSPNFYGTVPPSIANRNRINPPANKISSSVWRPVGESSLYPGAKGWNSPEFSYSFSGSNRDGILKFKATPGMNSEVTDAASDLLKAMKSGQSGMLNIAYSLAPYDFDYDGDNRPELVDSYIRLDADIEHLLDLIDKEYGADNALVFLSATGYADEPGIPDDNAKIPSGEITLKQAESLLNSYLSATYGNGDYVATISGGKLYLDPSGATKKNVDIKTLRKEAKDFLLRMGGVSEAVTIDEVLQSDNPRSREMALRVDIKSAPDIFLFFAPGWTVTDDNAYPSVSKKIRNSNPATPAFILSPALEPQTVFYTVEATSLAPTIASEINIRAPNAATSKPLSLKRKNGK